MLVVMVKNHRAIKIGNITQQFIRNRDTAVVLINFVRLLDEKNDYLLAIDKFACSQVRRVFKNI